MPSHPDHNDLSAAAFAALAAADPWAMYLIVPRREHYDQRALFSATSAAMMETLDLFSGHFDHREAIGAWRRLSYRKVVLRARASQWDALCTLPGAISKQRDEQVMALVPMRPDQRPERLRRLQVLNRPLAEMEPHHEEPPGLHLEVLVRSDLGMGLGKAMAQVAHAVMLTDDRVWQHPQSDWIRHWRELGRPVRARTISGSQLWMREAAETGAVSVRDAGLTEVSAGTTTVLAIIREG